MSVQVRLAGERPRPGGRREVRPAEPLDGTFLGGAVWRGKDCLMPCGGVVEGAHHPAVGSRVQDVRYADLLRTISVMVCKMGVNWHLCRPVSPNAHRGVTHCPLFCHRDHLNIWNA